MLSLASPRLLFTLSTCYPKNPDLSTTQSTFYSKDLIRNLRTNPLPLPTVMPFGKYHSDHMVNVSYDSTTGWSQPRLQEYHDFSLSPFISGLHYALQCFEGTKAYKNQKGQIRLFRLQANIGRLKKASVRLTLPDFDGHQLIKLIEQFVKTEQRWIPPKSQHSLYMRPFHFSTDDALGLKKPGKSHLSVVASPVGAYYASGFKPISIYCATESIRSAPMGTGSYKIGGNYGPTIQICSEVQKKGHQQVLWLLGEKVIEIGSSNVFFIFKDKKGEIEIVTPELEDLVLPGITRDSILELLRDEKEYKVTERQISITEVIQRHKRDEILQIFATGTAVIISSVNNIEYKGVNYPISVDPTLNFGAISHKLRQKLLDIQEGRTPDRFGWIRRLK